MGNTYAPPWRIVILIMKLRALSLILAGCAVVALAQDGVKLRRAFTAGSEDTYAFTFDLNMNMETPAGDQPIKIKGSNTYVVKYKEVKDSACTVDLVTKDIKIEADGPMGSPDDSTMPKEMTISGKLDDRNRLSDIKSAAAMPPMMQMMLSSLSSSTTGYFIEFPEGPIKVGDSWDLVAPKMAEKLPDVKLKAKLNADKDKAWEVLVTGKAPFKMNSADLAKTGADTGGMEVNVDGTMDTTYTVLVDKATGKTISVDGKVLSDLKLEIASMSMTIPSKGTTTFSAKLK